MMSTQEDEPYELGEILARLIVDGQNQIHDLRDGKATSGEITERMFASLGYWKPKVEALIQQAQLEARLDELEKLQYADMKLYRNKTIIERIAQLSTPPKKEEQ